MLRSWKFWLVLAAIGGVAGLFAYGFTVDPKLVRSPLIGKPAPDFAATLLMGGTISLAELRGTPVILNFWASWCVACREEAHVLEESHLRFEQEAAKLRVIGIAIQDTSAAAQAFAKQYGKTYTLALDADDGRMALDYGVYGVPETFFIGADGIIHDKHVGPLTLAEITAQANSLIGAEGHATR
jgi:cytochrome c biogenesis protein CcmG/thiol:disulfide interchange protein DsbE